MQRSTLRYSKYINPRFSLCGDWTCCEGTGRINTRELANETDQPESHAFTMTGRIGSYTENKGGNHMIPRAAYNLGKELARLALLL